MRTIGLIVVLAIAAMLMVSVACNGPNLSERPESDVIPADPALSPTTTSAGTAVPEPSLTTPSIDGATWILESLDGQPPIAGTYATLTIDGPQFGGFDGCNYFGGRHESGSLVVKQNGEISLPPSPRTAQGCADPPGILDQANRYLGAMQHQAKARVVDDRLYVIDRSGEVVLVFVRQTPLAGRPMDLVGTSWRLVDDGTYGEGVTTLLFLDSGAATGATACRDYTVGYTASNGRIRMPYKGMSGPAPLSRAPGTTLNGSTCSWKISGGPMSTRSTSSRGPNDW